MRSEVTDRYYRVFTYQGVDRVPDIEFGYWPQTIRRWMKEGMALDLAPGDTPRTVKRKAEEFFGMEREGVEISPKQGMIPPFEERIIERRERSLVMRDKTGCVAERFADGGDESSIPRFISFPVTTPDDWRALKDRYWLSEQTRRIPGRQVSEARNAAAEGRMVTAAFEGFYGQLRSWMGFENLSCAFYEYPAMVHEMVEHWAELLARQIEALPSDVVIDQAKWWEDMAGKNGPFVSPAMFREFFSSGYRRVMTALAKRGCALGIVDCDGNPHDLVPCWLDEGVNIMFPLEAAAGCDPRAWRREFGPSLRLRGAIAKSALIQGGRSVDLELDRLKPLLDEGGFIPHLDHLVPPDVPYGNYCEYLEKKRKMIGEA